MSIVGTGSGETEANGLCILSQNIMNEKIYLFLWFWFVFLMIIGSLQMVYEFAVLMVPSFRYFLLKIQMGSTDSSGKLQNYICFGCDVGDWFVLYQISKNMDKRFFRELVKKLAEDFKNTPQGDRATGKGTGIVATFGTLVNKASKGKQAEPQSNLLELETKDEPTVKTIDEKAVEVWNWSEN